jgi:hypothetical protein
MTNLYPSALRTDNCRNIAVKFEHLEWCFNARKQPIMVREQLSERSPRKDLHKIVGSG